MQLNTVSVSLCLAYLAMAQSSHSLVATPSHSVPIITTPAIPSASAIASKSSNIPSSVLASQAAAGSSPAASTLNEDEYDCDYEGRGCDWVKSEYGHGNELCGYSPYEAGNKLDNGGIVISVSKDGSGDCESQAGKACCRVLADEPCQRGQKYLRCTKP